MFTARIGYLISTGPTAQAARARAATALGRLVTRVEPAAATS
jgi:biotin carboxylase